MCVCVCVQATELAELTSKISLLEDAKKKKEEEASEWQLKVNMVNCQQAPYSGALTVHPSRKLLTVIDVRTKIKRVMISPLF